MLSASHVYFYLVLINCSPSVPCFKGQLQNNVLAFASQWWLVFWKSSHFPVFLIRNCDFQVTS